MTSLEIFLIFILCVLLVVDLYKEQKNHNRISKLEKLLINKNKEV